MSQEKPSGQWKCRACQEVWSGDKLYADPLVTGAGWTCGNLFCGGVVDRITAESDTYPECDDTAVGRI